MRISQVLELNMYIYLSMITYLWFLNTTALQPSLIYPVLQSIYISVCISYILYIYHSYHIYLSIYLSMITYLWSLNTTALQPSLLNPVNKILLVRIVSVGHNEGLETGGGLGLDPILQET